ncbi:MAG: DNA/RNA non-specific endonuclease [Lachnospiraceae bacterium]|nr:DNA/RNA non-specific endonuclease [Lachnospiraceae bacterium]
MTVKKRHSKGPLFTLVCAVCALIFGIGYPALHSKAPEAPALPAETSDIPSLSSDQLLEDGIPEYSGSPYIVVNGNLPDFDDSDRAAASSQPGGVFEHYSELDEFGRCGPAFACIGVDLMPTEERDSIGNVRPTGWHTVKYDHISGKYLYNRCHLIGYQLSGENANEKNLITGTRYLNVEGMLPFENEIADYVLFTENHVLYRVTPIFEGENLVASGVLLEAESVEDHGKEISFSVFCYNVQPGVVIDYGSGESRAESF